jgi:lipopolysaccharide/colanic/teichoic acid biosynthesis glycosyltransferase
MTPTKRAFDVACSAAGIVMLSPLLVLVSAAIVAHDGGSPFFSQCRIGRMGRPFRMFKFRTMVRDAERRGLQLTVGADPRITPVGRWLRKLKLDELPQLLNVLRGEMSLVGPRPEVPVYVDQYTPDQRRVLSLTPGITDPASIAYANESELLATAADPEQTYVHQIVPDKIRINLAYADSASLWSDVLVIFGTLRKVAAPATRVEAAR